MQLHRARPRLRWSGVAEAATVTRLTPERARDRRVHLTTGAC
jgi:hypothetical protein